MYGALGEGGESRREQLCQMIDNGFSGDTVAHVMR